MNGLRTWSTKKNSNQATNMPLYLQNDEVLSTLVLRMAQLEQEVVLQRCTIAVLESEINVLRNHSDIY